MTDRRRPRAWVAAGLALAAIVLPACDDDPDGVRGSGTLASEERVVSGFDEVALEGSGDLVIDVGGTESLTIEAEDNLLPFLTSDVNGSTLRLGTTKTLSPTTSITYTLGAVALEGISIAGSGDVEASGLDCATFDVSVAGAGTFDVGGTCGGLDVSIAGTGDFDGEDLVVATATVTINGSGQATVNASDELRVSINGAGGVEYIGDPATEIDINGSGDVHRR